MPISVRIILLSAAAAIVSLSAASPVARVISAQPLNVDGILTPARNFVPLSLGNEVTTDAVSAVIQFVDGASVTLQPHSTLRIEADPSGPVARVLRGSAIYDLAGSRRIANGASAPLAAAPAAAPLAGSAPSRGGTNKTPAGTGFLYRGPDVRQSGVAAPNAPAFVGSFNSGRLAAGTGDGPQIIGPNGTTVNLTASVNPANGATTYVVSSVERTIATPGGGTAVVTVTSGPLIGATVTGIGSTTPGGTSVAVSFTPPGSTVPLTPQQTAAALQTGIQQAINTGVANGTLPAGTQPPPPGPVTTGQFSASGS